MHDKTSVQRATADDSRAERETGEECLLSLAVVRFFFFLFLAPTTRQPLNQILTMLGFQQVSQTSWRTPGPQ